MHISANSSSVVIYPYGPNQTGACIIDRELPDGMRTHTLRLTH